MLFPFMLYFFIYWKNIFDDNDMEKENKKGKQAYKGARHKIHSEISYNSSKTNSMFLKL